MWNLWGRSAYEVLKGPVGEGRIRKENNSQEETTGLNPAISHNLVEINLKIETEIHKPGLMRAGKGRLQGEIKMFLKNHRPKIKQGGF